MDRREADGVGMGADEVKWRVMKWLQVLVPAAGLGALVLLAYWVVTV